MKKVIIALVVACSIIAGAIGAVVIAESRAGAELESRVTAFLDDCGTVPSSIDVRGRPYILSAAQGRVGLTYVDLSPVAGTNKDQLLVHRLVDGEADRLTRFVTFDYPSADASPVPHADGSYSDVASLNDRKVTFSAAIDDTAVQVLADGRPSGEIDLPQHASVRGVAATDDGVLVEVEYASSSCR